MEEDITKKPLVEIIKEMTFLDQEIELSKLRYEKQLLRYEKLRLEVVRRFPQIEQEKAFQKKIKE